MPSETKNPYTTPEDLIQGKKLYDGRCAGCHGPKGDGGKGANLAVPVLSRGDSDIAIYRVIRYGIPETEMPGHLMTQREIWQMTAHVRKLGGEGGGTVKGDPAKGALLFSGKGGCLQCHFMDGRGGHLGPPLTGVARKRSASYLREKLVSPDRTVVDSFYMVTATLRDGGRVGGVRLNEDTWSIQLRDGSRLISLAKADLASLDVQKTTPMPSYSRFAASELDDLVAYLLSAGAKQ
jgi:putative heme-binding domain-containing protein